MTDHSISQLGPDVQRADALDREPRETASARVWAQDVLNGPGMGVVAQEMVIARVEDIDVYAEARFLFRLVKDATVAASPCGDRQALSDLRLCAMALPVLIAEALRGCDSMKQRRHYNDALTVIRDLRMRTWDAFNAGWISGDMFDDVMVASSRCRIEIERAEQGARGRARQEVDGAW